MISRRARGLTLCCGMAAAIVCCGMAAAIVAYTTYRPVRGTVAAPVMAAPARAAPAVVTPAPLGALASAANHNRPRTTDPAWVSTAVDNGWTVGTWAAISGASPSHGLSATNNMRDVKSVNPKNAQFHGICSNWCGGAFAPDKGAHGTLIVGPGGGHGGYSENDVFGFDVETRTWTELQAAVGGAFDATFGEKSDGSIGAYHTYFQAAATGTLKGYPEGILILPKSISSQAGQTPDVSTPYPHFLDLARPEDGWTRLDKIPENGRRDAWRYAMAGLWDESRNRYWLVSTQEPQNQNLVAALDPLAAAGAQWEYEIPAIDPPRNGHGFFGSGIEQVLFRDPDRDLIVSIDWRGRTERVWYLFANDIGAYRSNTNTPWTVIETGSPPAKIEGGGLDWSPGLHAAIWWGGATTAEVWKFAYESGSVGTPGTPRTPGDFGGLTYRWTPLLDAENNAVTPEAQGSNNSKIYNRFRVVSFPSGVECALAVTHVGGFPTGKPGAVYAFRLK